MRAKLIASGIILILALGGGVLFSSQSQHITSTASSAMATPAFSWQDFDGKSHDLSEFTGQAVILHFWASWCVPCRAEFPKLLDAAKTVGKKVTFLVISSDADHTKALRFIQQMEATAKVKKLSNVFYAWDPKKLITYDIFQTALYPESIALDPAHEMRRKFSGPVMWDSPEIVDYLQTLAGP